MITGDGSCKNGGFARCACFFTRSGWTNFGKTQDAGIESCTAFPFALDVFPLFFKFQSGIGISPLLTGRHVGSFLSLFEIYPGRWSTMGDWNRPKLENTSRELPRRQVVRRHRVGKLWQRSDLGVP